MQLSEFTQKRIKTGRDMLIAYAFGCAYTSLVLTGINIFYLLGTAGGVLLGYALLVYWYSRGGN